MSAGLRYSEGGHRYTLDGERVPSVTTISKSGGGCEGLIKWSAQTTAEYAYDNRERLDTFERGEYLDVVANASKRERDRAASAGVEVHRIAQLLLADEAVQVPDELLGHVRQAVDLIERHDMHALLVEALVGSRRHKYAGRLDTVSRIVTVERGEHLGLIDWKTGRSVWSDVALQLAGYAGAEFAVVGDHEEPVPRVDAYYVAHVQHDSAELLPVVVDLFTWGSFLAARRLHDYTRVRRDDVIGAPLAHPPTLLDGTGPR